MDLNAVHMLVKVAETKSFTQAAHQLGTTQSRISRAVAQLEAELGTRLLHRNTRNVSLTPDGCTLVDRSAALIAGLDEARQLLLDRRCEPTGVLRMTAPSVLGRVVLTPLLGQLLERHPALQIDASFKQQGREIFQRQAVVQLPGGSRVLILTASAFRPFIDEEIAQWQKALASCTLL